jgi:anti-sigma B factor antagonist
VRPSQSARKKLDTYEQRFTINLNLTPRTLTTRRPGKSSGWCGPFSLPHLSPAARGSLGELFMSTPTRGARLSVEHLGDVTVVKFDEKKILDEQNIANIGEKLMDLVEKEGARKVVLNFENVDYLSSAALGKLINLHKRLVLQLKGQLVLCAIKEQIFEVFQITRLDKFFKIVKDEQDALKLF